MKGLVLGALLGVSQAVTFRFVIVTVCLIAGCNITSARNLALMVGVTRYDEKTIRTLEGPNNDIILLWRELRRRGFQQADMTVLAEDLPNRNDVPRPTGAPTRAAILQALKGLAETAQVGDFVVFQFSGHGSTQPVTDPAAQIEPEPDGRDQVLLPRDAGVYDASIKSIRNAIIDDELALALDAIRLKGATVWAVIDACHSGTVTRSVGDSVTRAVRSSSLGVPAGPGVSTAAPSPSQRSGTFVIRNAANKAPLIGFYAVDSRAEAIERPFPGYAAGMAGTPGRERIGVFTAHLVRAMTSGKAATFRDLARLTASEMTKLQGSASAPLPVFDGDLDRPIGGGEVVPAIRHEGIFDDKGIAIAAGGLHGFEVGAGVAIYDAPLGGKRIGKARIVEGAAATSIAQIEGATDLSFGSDVWVEVDEPAVSFTFRVARPDIAGGDVVRLNQIIDKAKDSGGRRALAIELVAPSEPADLRLITEQDRLWAVPDGQPLVTDAARPGTSISLDLKQSDNALAGTLRRVLWSMARASNLVRIASGAGERGEPAVSIEVDIAHDGDKVRAIDEKRTCVPLLKSAGAEQLTPAVPVVAGHCDQFSVSLKNNSDKDVDVGVFYLDSRAGIDLVDDRMANNGCVVTLPSAMSEPMRLPPRQFAIWEEGKPLALGMQRILVFAIPRSGSSPPSLCHLREPSIEAATRTATRSAGVRRGFAKLLSQAGLADGSVRSAAPTSAGDDPGSVAMVRQFIFDLQMPRQP
jgi:Caspase domain